MGWRVNELVEHVRDGVPDEDVLRFDVRVDDLAARVEEVEANEDVAGNAADDFEINAAMVVQPNELEGCTTHEVKDHACVCSL